MKQKDGEWKVVVTDRLYRALTGKKKKKKKKTG
jgi:hypothetical protein